MRRLIPLLLLVMSVGCKAPGHLVAGDASKIRVGMTKEELVKVLGKPDNVYADGTNETLIYILERPWWQDIPYQVRIVDNKVASYGDPKISISMDVLTK